jgi:ATP-grasp domain-containing protein
VHRLSGMPLTKELRLFFDAIAARVRSPFFTLDVARRTDGVWRVVEVGRTSSTGP